MLHYEEKLKGLLIGLLKGFAIALGIVIILVILTMQSTNIMESIGQVLLVWIILGLAISVFTAGSSSAFGALTSSILGMIKSTIVGGFVTAFASPFTIGLFVFKAIICGLVFILVMAYMLISFPLTIVYTIIMYIVERFVGEIAIARILDIVVSVASGVITIVLLMSMM